MDSDFRRQRQDVFYKLERSLVYTSSSPACITRSYLKPKQQTQPPNSKKKKKKAHSSKHGHITRNALVCRNIKQLKSFLLDPLPISPSHWTREQGEICLPDGRNGDSCWMSNSTRCRYLCLGGTANAFSQMTNIGISQLPLVTALSLSYSSAV